MPFFQSSKEKAIREDVEKNLQICISNSKKYHEAKDILVVHLNSSQSQVIETIVDNIKSTIKNEDLQPVRKYQAMLLLKDLMLTHNKALGKYVVKKILKRLTEFAQHKGFKDNEKDQQRGSDIFGPVKRDQQQYSIKFFTTLLIAIQQWGKNWPKSPDGPQKQFQKIYNLLLMNGIQFPKQKPREVSKSLLPAKKQKEQINKKTIDLKGQVQTKVQIGRDSSINIKKAKTNQSGQLKKFLQFYDGVSGQLQLLQSIMAIFNVQQIAVVRDIVNGIEQIMQSGNELVIIIDETGRFKEEESKISECFDFLQKIQKDLKILSKKPSQSETFKNKYIKHIKRLLETISSSKMQTSKTQQLSKLQTKQDLPTQTARNSQITAPQTTIKKAQQPKIKNNNRYTSTQGLQLNQFNKNHDFQSNSGQSVHSERFGSFGGPGHSGADRNRISVNAQAVISPDKQKRESVTQIKKEKMLQKLQPAINLNLIAQEKIENFKQHKSQQSQNKQSKTEQLPKFQQQTRRQQQHVNQNSQNVFGQFIVDGTKEKNSIKSVNNFREDSFAINTFEQGPQQGQVNFFDMIEKKQGKQMQNGRNGRRNKANKQEIPENDDFFKANLNSKIDSHLSGFQFSQKNFDKPDNYLGQPQLATENTRTIEDNSGVQNRRGSQVGWMKKRESIQSKKSFEFELINQPRNRQQNPFSTGNFGNVITQPNLHLDPFETNSIHHTNNNIQNPFNNQSLYQISNNMPTKLPSQNQFTNHPNLNPFQSTIPPPLQNPFQPNIFENPFENSTHKSNYSKNSKNAFEQNRQVYKPPTTTNIPGRRNENILKNIGENVIRDSLVFEVKIQKNNDSGLNFSQFQDVGEHRQSSPDPFFQAPNQNKKETDDFSGFSLSNFQNIKKGVDQQEESDYFRKKTQQKQPSFQLVNQNGQFNQNPIDFFSKFQKSSKKSKPSLSQSNNFFQEFQKGRSVAQKQNFNKKNQSDLNFFENKTSKSQSQHSFNFDNLERLSGIQSKRQIQQVNLKISDFQNKNPPDKQKNYDQKESLVQVKAFKKPLGWADFDKQVQQSQRGEICNQSLDLQSRIGSKGQLNSQKRMDVHQAIESQIGTKRGVDWNPMILLRVRQQAGYYLLDDKKMSNRRREMTQARQLYQQKINLLQFAKIKNDQIRKLYLQKMKKMDEIISMRAQYQQIYKKIKENNDSKEQKLQDINRRIKKAKNIKSSMLDRERKLFQLTKISHRESKDIPARSMSSKWQMFNKSLTYNRNHSMVAYQSYSQGY